MVIMMMNQSVLTQLRPLLLLVILLAAVDYSNCAPVNETIETIDAQGRTDAQRVIDAIPIADRAFFVTFHMALEAEQQGRADVSVSPDFSEMPEDRHIEFQAISVPDDFGRNLLDWAEHQAASGAEQERSFLPGKMVAPQMEVCFPSGCVDPNDLGTNCCPF